MEAGPERARPDPSLYRRASQGDPEALEWLFEHHWPWVKGMVDCIIFRLPHLGCCEKQDVLNDAGEELIKALRRYDVDRGARFEAYARPAIRGAIITGVARCLELSEAARHAFPHVFDALEELTQEGVSNPTPSQIQEKMKKKGHPFPLHVIMEVLNRVRLAPLTQGDEDFDPDGIEEERWNPQKGPADGETIMEDWDRIKGGLGQEEGRKFAVLAILYHGLGYKWDEIVCLLSAGGPSDWAKEWAICIQMGWPHVLSCFPGLDDWEEVLCWFKDPPPRLSAVNLRQWYSRRHRELRHKPQ
jgi:hypothetical protein